MHANHSWMKIAFSVHPSVLLKRDRCDFFEQSAASRVFNDRHYRYIDRWTNIQIDMKADRQTAKHADKHRDRHTQTDAHTDRHTDRHTKTGT